MDDPLRVCNSSKVSGSHDRKVTPQEHWIGCPCIPSLCVFATKQVIAKPTWPQWRCYKDLSDDTRRRITARIA